MKDLKRVSKKLSFHLRHEPDLIGISLDPQGWVSVDVLLRALASHGFPLTRAELDEVVANNDKRRFAFDETGTRIRASQGHSVSVDLALPDAVPPAVLYHGTVARFLGSIMRDGLKPGARHAVHLSATTDTAVSVGARRGKPVILSVDAAAMHLAGHKFQLSANGVWLTQAVPPAYLTFA
ncbi:RNA 2'-phosphotransferase [Amycolatopsis sp. NPDC059657]|uniref:RNA 2'-phosphotransferase n=1 Tax=Amycolatopsis sp. NPDC059657 TaxID=3346899 RepID=UPI00366CDAC1